MDFLWLLGFAIIYRKFVVGVGPDEDSDYPEVDVKSSKVNIGISATVDKFFDDMKLMEEDYKAYQDKILGALNTVRRRLEKAKHLEATDLSDLANIMLDVNKELTKMNSCVSRLAALRPYVEKSINLLHEDDKETAKKRLLNFMNPDEMVNVLHMLFSEYKELNVELVHVKKRGTAPSQSESLSALNQEPGRILEPALAIYDKIMNGGTEILEEMNKLNLKIQGKQTMSSMEYLYIVQNMLHAKEYVMESKQPLTSLGYLGTALDQMQFTYSPTEKSHVENIKKEVGEILNGIKDFQNKVKNSIDTVEKRVTTISVTDALPKERALEIISAVPAYVQIFKKQMDELKGAVLNDINELDKQLDEKKRIPSKEHEQMEAKIPILETQVQFFLEFIEAMKYFRVTCEMIPKMMGVDEKKQFRRELILCDMALKNEKQEYDFMIEQFKKVKERIVQTRPRASRFKRKHSGFSTMEPSKDVIMMHIRKL
ncbi:hypothetical protein BdWA1_000267 [Babesia duncani]|uniref:Uncharacterized protein n=1 Tax=Babesia duncani TaxID=323732 RepID=A0AAD9PM25_9APIC|nr:hypothetical protein BdWA1_000267 [Babesia duncani]